MGHHRFEDPFFIQGRTFDSGHGAGIVVSEDGLVDVKADSNDCQLNSSMGDRVFDQYTSQFTLHGVNDIIGPLYQYIWHKWAQPCSYAQCHGHIQPKLLAGAQKMWSKNQGECEVLVRLAKPLITSLSSPSRLSVGNDDASFACFFIVVLLQGNIISGVTFWQIKKVFS